MYTTTKSHEHSNETNLFLQLPPCYTTVSQPHLPALIPCILVVYLSFIPMLHIYRYSGLTKSAKVLGSSKLWCPSGWASWWWSCASSVGPTYSILRTFPHSGQRSMGRSRDIWDMVNMVVGDK